MLHPGYVRYFEAGIRALAEAGHAVHVAFEISREKLNESEVAARLATLTPLVTCGPAPDRAESVRDFLARGDRTATRAGQPERPGGVEAAWSSLATTVRLMEDYLHFFEPAFAGATALRARAEKRLPRIYRPIVRAAAPAWAAARATCWLACCQLTERLIPTEPGDRCLPPAAVPDLVLVTPLVELGSQQVDYVKSARRMGVRSALSVASWDNLTSKGLIRVAPDHVVVWNEAQRAEASTLHQVPPERVVTTGAQLFDEWFDAWPSRTRDVFCREVGLDPWRPFLLYVGSSSFIAPDEVPFVERWLSRLRRAPSEAVRTMGVLVRPHPANSRQWRALRRGVVPAGVAVARGRTPSPTAIRPGVTTWTRCGTARRWSASTPARRSRPPSSAGRCSRFATPASRTRRTARCTSGIWWTAADRCRWRTRWTRTWPNWASSSIGARSSRGRRASSSTGSCARTAWTVLPRPSSPPRSRSCARCRALPPSVTRGGCWRCGRWAWLKAYVAHLLAEDRPLWVYALRPFLAAGVWLMAAAHGPGAGWLAIARLAWKRVRRAGWRVWYESSRAAELLVGRVRKLMVRGLRHAGRVARRVVGRQA